jgi:hypothetical protein
MNLHNDLQKLSAADYAACLGQVVQALADKPFVVSVYQFGSVNFPGISDLDLLVVLESEDDYDRKKDEVDSAIAAAPHAGYCFYHGAIVVPLQTLPFLHLFHSVEQLKRLHGNEVAEAISARRFGIEQALAWNCYFYQAYLELLSAREASLRCVLLLLNNLATSIRLNDEQAGTGLYAGFKDEVDGLRRDLLAGGDADAGDAAHRLLAKGVWVLSEQERLLDSPDPGLPLWRYDRGERRLFLRGKTLRRWKIGGLQVFTLPARYFRAREEVAGMARNLQKDGISLDDYLRMRSRLLSVKILDF